MNVELIKNADKSNAYMEKVKYGNPSYDNARIAESMAGYSLDITGKVMENAAYGKEDLLSAEDIAAKAGLVDVKTQRNYMAVMSNSMSDEDFSELLKDGYNPTHTDIKEQVTSLDKIKAKLAQSGTIIDGFNDNLSTEELEEALDMAGKIIPLSDDNKAYMIRNEMEPTISNLYMAEHSSSSYGQLSENAVVYNGGSAYATPSQTESFWESIKPQAEEIVKKAGVDEIQGIEDAKWLVLHQIPLTEENIISYREISSLTLPVRDKEILDSIKVAAQEGKALADANLLETESIYKKAVDLIDEFANANDSGSITRKRQLEEIRLSMTVEANMTLLRKGISIDTNNLEGIVEKLKEAEREFFRPILENKDSSSLSDNGNISENDVLTEKIELYKSTGAAIEYLKNTAPAQSVSDLIATRAEFNLSNLKKTAETISASYIKAGAEYEKLMTTPRADMGDSITKAFRNVDDILTGMGLDISEDNRKAVRTLGYSQVQITEESIEQVRTATRTVTSVIEMMTPAKTLQLIKEGHNPLKDNLYELKKQLGEISTEESAEKYSEFLLKLERRGEITEDEKSAFIGMYRLFEKIERQDSRVIGKVLDKGQELTFNNLLSAYRSRKLTGLDINIDDDFGLLENVISKGESITDQIERGFRQLQNEETPKEYISDKQAMVREAFENQTGLELLKETEMPITIENILAANDFGASRKKLFAKLGENEDGIRSFSSLIKTFEDKEGLEDGYEKCVKSVLDNVEEKINASASYEDVKDWLRLHKQIEIAGSLAKRDEYEFPVETEEGLITIRLKINQGTEQEGKVEASFETENFGKIKALFSVKEDDVSVIVSAQYEGGLNIIQSKEEAIRIALNEAKLLLKDVTYVKASTEKEMSLGNGAASNSKLFKVAKTFLEAMEKE